MCECLNTAPLSEPLLAAQQAAVAAVSFGTFGLWPRTFGTNVGACTSGTYATLAACLAGE